MRNQTSTPYVRIVSANITDVLSVSAQKISVTRGCLLFLLKYEQFAHSLTAGFVCFLIAGAPQQVGLLRGWAKQHARAIKTAAAKQRNLAKPVQNRHQSRDLSGLTDGHSSSG